MPGSSIWPLSANILDPVRASIVCSSPEHLLEVAKWFCPDGSQCASGSKSSPDSAVPSAGSSLLVLKVKNKFAYVQNNVRHDLKQVLMLWNFNGLEQVEDGYRDIKLFVRFVQREGLGIIGEIQIHDKILYDLKLQVDCPLLTL